jgi:hypothetical protein
LYLFHNKTLVSEVICHRFDVYLSPDVLVFFHGFFSPQKQKTKKQQNSTAVDQNRDLELHFDCL